MQIYIPEINEMRILHFYDGAIDYAQDLILNNSANNFNYDEYSDSYEMSLEDYEYYEDIFNNSANYDVAYEKIVG